MDAPAAPTAGDLANQRMVDRMIVEGALWSVPAIQAFRQTPRHRFLDRVYLYHPKRGDWREVRTGHPGDAELKAIYSDRALVTHLSSRDRAGAVAPISSSSQPSLMAEMLEDLRIERGHKVLEVGAGTGYNAALMGHLVSPGGRVVSLEVDRETLAEAWVHLRAFPDRPVEFVHGDGRQGRPTEAPFDRIMVTASTPDLEPAWLEQLAPLTPPLSPRGGEGGGEGGLLLAPVSFAPGLAYLVRGGVRNGVFQGQLTRPAYFMPLRAEAEAPFVWKSPPAPGESQTLPAPWADWFGKSRLRRGWPAFCHALAFYGWLRGLEVSQQSDASGYGCFGLFEPGAAVGCWLGLQEWHVFGGTAGRDLAWQHWRAFLDAGAPRPTEFEVEVSTADDPAAQSGAQYCKQLPCGRWLWALRKERERPVQY